MSQTGMTKAGHRDLSPSFTSSSFFPSDAYKYRVSPLKILLVCPRDCVCSMPLSLFFVRLSRPFSPSPTGPSEFTCRLPVGLNSCGRPSSAFVSCTLRSLTVRGLAPVRAAARGERRVRGRKAQERRQQGFTTDGKLKTGPCTGPWKAGGRVVDWIRRKRMNRTWRSKFSV
jgi:hypothetical protein